MTDLDDKLRQEIERSGKSAKQLERESGVPQPTITRFLQGADMRLSRASQICRVLKLVLRRRDK